MTEEFIAPDDSATTRRRGDAAPWHAAYGLAAEARAVEGGHNARVLPDGSVLVKSDSQPGSYRVWIRGVRDGILRFGCTCRSGFHRASFPVPCKHAALAGRRLEREGFARWHDGAWRIGQRAQVLGLRLLLAAAIRSQPRPPARAEVTGSEASEQLQPTAEAA
ncbi:MAG TPA: hypothetical protein VGC06_31170 [Actinomycetes bacterium]